MSDQEENQHLTDSQKKILDTVLKGEVAVLKELLKDYNDNIDFLDYTGMTCLQHAAFRGKFDMCELLLSRGADVNSNKHENGYTALMFAALSGNVETTQLMMEHGAKVDAINSVGRTAAQMAGFVGQHHVVAVINSFFGKEGLERYTKPQGLEKEAKLQADTFTALHRMMNTFNLNPIKLVFFLRDNTCLLEKSDNVVKVLENMCEKFMKARDTNDAMAMKSFYFSIVIREAAKYYKSENNSLDKFIKFLSKKKPDGRAMNQESLVMKLLAEFPYGHSQLFQTIKGQIRLSTQKSEKVSVLNLLVQGINGQKFSFDEENDCSTCGSTGVDLKRCTKCKMVSYCDRDCQKLDWAFHKTVCDQLLEIAQENAKLEKENQNKQKKIDPASEEEVKQKLAEMEILKAKIEVEEEKEAAEKAAVEASETSQKEKATELTNENQDDVKS